MKYRYLLCALSILAGTPATAAAEERWYSEEQVQRGEALFRQNCAACHGQNAEGTADWKKRDANGNFPPPPLNGTAHTWHHDLDLLRRTIREGGQKLGGVMPAFEGKLEAGEIDAIIAFFQSKWSDELYQRWSGRFLADDLPALTDIVTAARRPVTMLLQQRIGNTRIDDVRETAVEGMWEAQVGNRYVYLLDGGKYAIMGDLVDLESGRNLTEQARRLNTVETLAAFADEDMVVFPAEGERKATLTVFTDTTCPYCQKLHGEIGELQAAGVTVRYLPYARGGKKGPGYDMLKSVWCASDRKKAMTDAKNERLVDLPPGDCPQAAVVDRGYLAGNRVGISGTPALILDDGEKIEGYRPYQELIPYLFK